MGRQPAPQGGHPDSEHDADRQQPVALALLMVVVFVAFGTISTMAAGLGQRVLVGAELLWLLLAASRLRTIAAPRAADRLST